MNKYQKKLSREIKNYMNYYDIDKEEYAITKYILKTFRILNVSPCEDCIKQDCKKEKNKLIWCEDRI